MEAMTSMDFGRFGLAIGHATDVEGATGCTVVRGVDAAIRAAAHVVGRGTGTRELGVLDPSHLVDRVDAIFLTGGSAYGLDAAAGVMRWMEERGRGHAVGTGVVPIVPAAVIFDLGPLGRADRRPTAAMAYDACEAARATPVAEGSVGAGTGATVGKAAGVSRAMKGGVGCAVLERGAAAAGAVAVVNALGDVRDARGEILAGARDASGGFADSRALLQEGSAPSPRIGGQRVEMDAGMANTTLCVVAVDVALSRIELLQLARAASGALHRRITPVGTSFDGDVVFAVAPVGGTGPGTTPPALLLQLEVLASDALEQAIERAVRSARGRDGVPGLADGTPAR